MEDTSPSAEDQLSTSDLAARITELAGQLNSANHRWLRLIAEFDRRNGWSDGCTRSCAHWLGWKCGLDMGAAREKVRVASPATEEVLLNIALHGTTHHVETLVRQFRRADAVVVLAESGDARVKPGATLRLRALANS
jgi:hypothetical protein